MSKLSSVEITKLLDALIGRVEPIGETNFDAKAFDNLQTLIDVADWCLEWVANARDYIHCAQSSMNKVGYTAQCAMQAWADWLEERREDADNSQI